MKEYIEREALIRYAEKQKVIIKDGTSTAEAMYLLYVWEVMRYWCLWRGGTMKTMTLEKAMRLLGFEYAKAKTLEYVRNPIAWALYQVWKKADAERNEA